MTLLCLGVPFNESTQKMCTKRDASPVHTTWRTRCKVASLATNDKGLHSSTAVLPAAAHCACMRRQKSDLRHILQLSKREYQKDNKKVLASLFTAKTKIKGCSLDKRMLGTYRGQQCCSHALYHTLQLCLFTAPSVYTQPRAFLVDSLICTPSHIHTAICTPDTTSQNFRKGEIRSTSFTRESFSQVLGLQ